MSPLPKVSRRRERAHAALRAMWPGVKLGWIPIALVVLAHVPGRRVFAENEALHGRPGWQFFCAGLVGDLLYVGPPVLLAFILPLAVGAVFEGRRPPLARASRIVTTALATLLLVAAWMFSVGAIESKLERGLYPTYLETKVALGSSSFVTGQLPTLLLDRYWKTSALALLASSVLFYLHGRRAPRDLRSRASVAGFALAGLLLFGGACEIVKLGRVVFPRTGSYAETRSPIENVALGRFPFPNHTPITDGMRLLFSSRTGSFSADEKRAGLRTLGYAPEALDRLVAFEGNEPCTSGHPLARPLDHARAPGSKADDVVDDLEALSAALFDGGKATEPLVVFQIAMESFRADDIHALQPLAPPELTPVMTRLYADRERTIAFRGAFQGGFRTAQNLSSLTCGIGSLPFNIAIARDLGHFPLRCLPDVLADGGFDTHAFYASDMTYDSMLDFFRYHGVEVTQAADMPAGLPIGSWRGISDRALYTQALAHASAATHPTYEFVLTLSGHSPFSAPTDMPPEVAARAAAACKKSPSAKEDDCSRLAVMAYADHALGELLENLERSPLAHRSIVVLSADHATSEMFLWPGSPEEKSRAHVPYVIYVPRALAAAAARPAEVASLVARLHDRAASPAHAISLTDSPTLVTALLSSTAEVKAIPDAWRFHTYGGQATSPHFAFDARPSARVWGTDSAAFVFSADADASVTAFAIKNRAFSGPEELATLNPSLRGPAAFLASFTKGYLTRCESRPLRMTRMTSAVR
ncbi:MAG: sulfatase [Myxococcaceae bacterium]|nr:sulfatase [Myxococcaceae bacterium]